MTGSIDGTDRTEPDTMWINAMSCIRPSDEFLIGLGREIVAKVMRDGGDGFPKELLLKLRMS